MPVVDERARPDATIVIVTKDRRAEALRAVASARNDVPLARAPERLEEVESILPEPASASARVVPENVRV